MRGVAAVLASLLVAFAAGPAAAASGTVGYLDKTFGTNGVAAIPSATRMFYAFGTVAVGVTGRIAVTSSYSTSTDGARQELTVFTASGHRDAGFHGGRFVSLFTDPNGECCGIDGPFVTADGGVDVGFGTFQGMWVDRFTPSGNRSWRATFAVGDGHARAVLAGGSVRAIGTDWHTDLQEPTAEWLLGITPAGQKDTRVGPNGIRELNLDHGPQALVADAANRLYVVANQYGTVSPDLADRSIVVERLSSSGVVDATYGSGGSTAIPVGADDASPLYEDTVGLAPDGSLFIAGEAASATTGKMVVVVRKLDPTGALAAAFGDGGVVEIPGATGTARLIAIAVDHDGRPILSILERGSPSRPILVRLDAATGALDPSFGGTGTIRVANLVTGLAIDPNGKLLTVSRVAKGGAFVLVLARRSI